jgi:hypothetical protein
MNIRQYILTILKVTSVKRSKVRVKLNEIYLILSYRMGSKEFVDIRLVRGTYTFNVS